MKKTLILLCCLLATLITTAQDKKIKIISATAETSKQYYEAEYAIDNKVHTYWINSDDTPSDAWPLTFIITFEKETHVDYVRYIPRENAFMNEGNWDKVYVSYCPTTTGEDFKNIGSYTLNQSSNASDLWLGKNGITCGQIRFDLERGGFFKVAAAEIEAYALDHERYALFNQYFSDAIFSQLRPDVKSSEGINDLAVKRLVDSLLANGNGYRKFRVGEYEPYMTTRTLQERLKTSSSYNNYENPTGVYLKAGETCLVAVDGIDDNYPVGVTIKNWVENENTSSYPLRNGLNQITARTEGNLFIHYYTDNYKEAPNVKVHFINAPVQGYWDQATMTNEDWIELLKGRSTDDNTILITRSEHAQLAYPVSSWIAHCPTNVDSTMTLYQQVQWAERDILGLEKYGRQVKNRQLFYATEYGFMAAGGEGSYCHVNSLGAIMVPNAARFDFWGVGHEWGHNNQVTPGFKWPGCGETTNNIYASWGQIHFTGTPHNLRLEDEISGIGEYANMRGGRMQSYFEEGLRKGIPWQLQDGPDYHGDAHETKTVKGENANGDNIGYVTTTSRNYDHFVKLAPFWQINLWGTLAGKCPDIIPMTIESIRSTKDYGTHYNTSGKQQINWMKLACDSAKIDLLPFFEKAGMLRPIHAFIEDYTPGWNIIDSAMIAALKAHVKEQGYPAFSEEINYINGHNYTIYRDCLKLEVPKELGVGCKVSGNKVIVQHSAVKNAVAYETYNSKGKLLRITMYGLGSDDQHSYTQVLYPTNKDSDLSAAYIMAVGYDGTRIKIYEEGGAKEEFFTLLEQARKYATRTDSTGKMIGFIKPEFITDYTTFIAQIDSTVQHTDARECSYGIWVEELKAHINALLSKGNPLIPNNTYTFATSSSANKYISNSSDGLILHTFQENKIPETLKWNIIQTDSEGVYCIRHRITGLYITSVSTGQYVIAESPDIAAAVPFSLESAVPGEFYIQHATNPKIKLYTNKNILYAGNVTDASARWFLHIEENKSLDELITLPRTSTDEQLHIYYLIRTDNGEYAYNSTSPKYKGRISSGIYDSSENTGYWYYFKQGSQKEKYTIHSYKTGLAVTNEEAKLYVHKDREATEFTIRLAEQNQGFILSTEGGSWYMETGSTDLLELSTETYTTWKLQHARTISPAEDPSADITKDKASNTLMVHSIEGVITIEGLSTGCIVNVYNAIGKLIATSTATGDIATIRTELRTGDIAIITVGKQSMKVQIR